MAENRRPVAFLFIFLLAGQQVYQVAALRTEESLDLASDLDSLGWSSAVPSGDEGCKMEGSMLKANRHCVPDEYCEYKLWVTGAYCRLVPLFWPDARIAADFGAHSGKALVQSESFAQTGSTWNFYKLKGTLAEMSETENAISSEKVEGKVDRTLAKKMKDKYINAPISEYHEYLQESEAKLADLKGKVFDLSSIDEDSRSKNGLAHFMANINTGSAKNSLVGKWLAKIDMTKLEKLQGEAEPKQETFEECFPGVEKSVITDAIAKAIAKKKEVEAECKDDDKEVCLKREQEKELVELDEKAEIPEGEDVDELKKALLQHLSKTRNITTTGDHETSLSSLFQLAEEHGEELENAEDEAARNAFFEVQAMIAVVVAFIVVMFIFCFYFMMAIIVVALVILLLTAVGTALDRNRR